MTRPTHRRRYLFEVLLLVVLGTAVIGSTLALTRQSDDLAFYDPIIDIKHFIDARFVDEPNEDTMQLGAIDGMIDALNDPYTVYIPARKTTEFQKELTGEYVGIGAQVNVQDGWLTIVSPLEDSPAYRAGLMADDRVVEIEGESTYGLDAQASVDKLMGEPGKPVHLVIERDGTRIPIEILRQQIKTRSVKGVHRDPDDPQAWRFMIDPVGHIGYIRLTQFTPECAREVGEALDALHASRGELAGLVLDLRWNPGGVLDEAVSIADMFLDEGVIVSTKGRAHKEQVSRAHAQGTLPDFPIVVMVNGQSASASEVLAGALLENDRAIVLGTRSFGKGSVQSIYSLPSTADGAQLKITEQYYYLPSGRLIHRKPDSTVWGVDPTPGFWVATTPDEDRSMFRVRQQEEVIRAGQASPGDWADPAWILEHLKDPQLAAAVEAIRKRQDTGAWAPTGGPGLTGVELVSDELNRDRQIRERMLREFERLQERIDELEQVAGTDAPTPTEDLWDDSDAIVGGRVEVYDAAGKRIADLRITGDSLERWLIDAPVEPADPADDAD